MSGGKLLSSPFFLSPGCNEAVSICELQATLSPRPRFPDNVYFVTFSFQTFQFLTFTKDTKALH